MPLCPSSAIARLRARPRGIRLRDGCRALLLFVGALLLGSCDRPVTAPLVPLHPRGLIVATAGAYTTIDAGELHSCALRPDGVVGCWGVNTYGQAPTTHTNRIAGARFQQVSAGYYHTCALGLDNVVECWGYPDGRAPAVRTSQFTGGFLQVSAGGSHSCAVNDMGNIECWGPAGIDDDGRAPALRSSTSGAYSQVSSGVYHTCALVNNGVVECFGRNNAGQVEASRTAGNGGRFVQVSAGEFHSCALRDDGVAECWGDNTYGQAPATQAATTGKFTQIGAGDRHTCALRDDGVAECWGTDVNGESPATRAALDGPAFTQLTVGGSHSCGLRGDGIAECWGYNQDGRAPAMKTANYGDLDAGELHTCALRPGAAVECWGVNNYGQAPAPRTPATGGWFTQVSAGYYHTCALRSSDGKVECWGYPDGRAPAVKGSVSGRYSQVSAGGSHTCALREDGQIECWGPPGINDDGRAPPVRVGLYTLVSAGVYHTCALRGDGVVECFGRNNAGQVEAVRAPTGGGTFVQVSAGEFHTCALRDDGVAECWGDNTYGQAPATQAASSGSFTQVGAGDRHSCALRADGVAECWGTNVNGESPATRAASDGSAFVTLSVGGSHACALRPDGVAECWGYNQDGRAPATRAATMDSAHVLPIASFSAPSTAHVGQSFAVSFRGAHVPRHPEATTFSYSLASCNGEPFVTAPSGATSMQCIIADPGAHTVIGRVTDQDGDFSEYRMVVTATANSAPTAVIVGGPFAGSEGSAVAFDGSGSSDADGDAITYLWSFGDGTTAGGRSAVERSHTYVNNGTYTVTLTVTDGGGLTSAASTTATIANVAPTGTFVIPSNALENSKAVLTFASVTDPGKADVLQYAFDCGDGNGYGAVSPTKNRPCVPPDNGMYAVKGRVQDADGGVTEYTGTLTATNVAPTATLSAPTKSIPEGSSYVIALTKPVDAPTDLPTLRYSMSCDYGPTSNQSTSNSLQCPAFDNGTRSFSARISDKDNGSTVYTGSVQVVNVAPTITITSSAVGGGGNRFSLSITYTVTDPMGSYDASTVCNYLYCSVAFVSSIDYGDGSGPQVTYYVPGAQNPTLVHSYRKLGNFTVTMTARDKDGGVGTTSVKVAIK